MVQQPLKMSARVVNAIRNLREAHGSTSKEIMNYIMSQCNVPESTVQRQMQAALKRGLDYGILMKNNGHYFLNTEPELRFASSLSPVEKSRRRRRGRSRRRKGRRRSRGRKRRKSRRRRRPRRRVRSRAVRARRVGRDRCRCTKRGAEIHVLGDGLAEPRILEDDASTCEKESNAERRSGCGKTHDRSMSHSESSMNSERDGAIDDRRSIHDQD